MEIKDRLIKIIASEGLTSAAFADSIGVQRSSISHIVSGRNNPSLDFLQKILLSFPKYNAEWLIMGLGDIYKRPTQSNLFNESSASLNTQETGTKIDELHAPLVNSNVTEAFKKDELHLKTFKEEDEPIYNSMKQPTLERPESKGKQIHKIVFFYADKSFGEYYPEQL